MREGARSCPHCGSDEKTGWSTDTYLDGVGLPDDTSYEEMCRDEFGSGQVRHGGSRRRILFMAIACVVTAVLVIGTLMALR
jgi:hypothetical protein